MCLISSPHQNTIAVYFYNKMKMVAYKKYRQGNQKRKGAIMHMAGESL